MRAAIFSTKDVVGSHGVYNFKPESLFGDDRKALVLVKLEQGKWTYLKQ
jgi:branched-chain amino acid transport system substrate-binding protein